MEKEKVNEKVNEKVEAEPEKMTTLTFEQAEKMASRREQSAYQRGIDEQKNIFKSEQEKVEKERIEADRLTLVNSIESDSNMKEFIEDIADDYKSKNIDFLNSMVKAYGKKKDNFQKANTASPTGVSGTVSDVASDDFDSFFAKQKESK